MYADFKREAVRDMYNNPAWSARVDKMSDRQVAAIYAKKLDKERTNGADG